jgi:tetratricopeptide (TPR) repeat protein
MFNSALDALDRGDLQQAVVGLESSLKHSSAKDQHVQRAFALLAKTLLSINDASGSLTVCEAGLRALGDDPELHFRAGQACTALKKFEEAKLHYSAIDENSPALGPKRNHNLALTCMELGERFEAREWLRKAADSGFAQSAVAMFEFAFDESDLVTAANALDSYRALGGIDSLWVSLSLKLASQRGQTEEEFLLQAVKNYPEDPAPAIFLAKQLLESGREDEAEPYLKLLEKKGHPDAHYLKGALAGRKGEYISAIAHTRRALEIEPNHEAARTQLEVLNRATGFGG